MKRRMLTAVALLSVAACVVALGSASANDTAQAALRLSPGKWQGVGKISGSITDDAATTTFSGKLGFQLTVRKDLYVHGKGSWAKTMTGRGLVDSDLTGIAFLTIGGTSDKIVFDYMESVDGTITANGMQKPVSFDSGEDFKKSSLVIQYAKKCHVGGYIPVAKESGVKITWTAKKYGCKG
jgi:polyisoprenoid-binding protein YceI